MVLTLLLSACSQSEPSLSSEPGAAPSGARLVSVAPALLDSGRVAVTTVTVESVGGTVAATGEIVAPPDAEADISVPVPARVRSIGVSEGDVVKQGALLATLDAGDVARTSADLARARARRIRATRVLAQEKQLLAEHATSERAVGDAESELAAARAEERGASLMLTTWKARGGAHVVLEAPIDGTVVKRRAVLGGPADPGQVLFRIVDTARLLLRADVPEGDAPDVALGARASLEWPGRAPHCGGLVEARAPSVDAMRRTVPFRVRPDADCPALLEGAFVDVQLPRLGTAGRRLPVVPRDALTDIDGVPLMFVATSTRGEFTVRAVRVAEQVGERVFIDDGLKAGEQVASRGAILLKGELMRAALE
ncbi:MAG: efflux RND transporter periplasmic adaptor subunit [Sorangiineae bacterium]|nr:efflux RND transporter periplasmic adaptor subunit [Polyangiaceae bacterium]MEB2324050.1 efflux RND transporter periplasmic adaptor subunit [Sorangiineae bacterium]